MNLTFCAEETAQSEGRRDSMAYFLRKVSSLALQHLTNVYLLSIYYTQGSVVGLGNMVVNKTDKRLFFTELGEDSNEIINT